MSIRNLLKLAAEFETKLAQGKPRIPYQTLQQISNTLGIINSALTAQTKEEAGKFIIPKFLNYENGTTPEHIEGNIRGRSYLSINHDSLYKILIKDHKNILSVYQKLIDGGKPDTTDLDGVEQFAKNIASLFQSGEAMKQTLFLALTWARQE